MTIGDVLAVVAGIVGIGISGWALLVILTLLFPTRVEKARRQAEQRPWRCLAGGALLTFVCGGASLALLNHPAGPIKLFGWALLIGLTATGALGASGLAVVAGERSLGLEPRYSELRGLSQGAALLIVAGFVPLIGWFFVLPLAFVVSVGAGARALWNSRAFTATEVAPVPAPQMQRVQAVTPGSVQGPAGEALT